MTNQSHTELAAQARRAVKSLEILDMDSTADLLRQCAAALESPEQVQGEARPLIEMCRAALAEELSAWDLDPPLHHVKEAHDACEAWLSTPPTAPAQDAQEKRA